MKNGTRYEDHGLPFRWKVHESPRVGIDENGIDTARSDVVIVGGGPTGLGLAVALGRAGVSVVVLEQDSTVCRSSRASGISRSTFEAIDRWSPGSGANLAAQALPTLGSTSYFRGQKVFHHRHPEVDSSTEQYPPNSYLSQWNIEAELVRAISSLDTVQLRWQSHATGVVQEADGVTVAVSSAQEYQIRTDWVIAADGGKSEIRRATGTRMEGVSYEAHFVIVDAIVNGTTPEAVRRVWFDPDYLPGGLLLRHMSPDGLWRFDFQFPLGTDPGDMLSEARLLGLINAHIAEIGHDATEVNIVWASSYRANARALPEFRRNRILFAGDAAHVVPIFGGFGLNSAIEDVDNLAWKLAWLIQGRARTELLDTYHDERHQAVTQGISEVVRAAEFMTPSSPASEQLRIAALTLARDGNDLAASLGRHRTYRQQAYPESAIVRTQDTISAGLVTGTRIPSWLQMAQGAAAPSAPDGGHRVTIQIFEDSHPELTSASLNSALDASRIRVIHTCSIGPRERELGVQTGDTLIVRPDAILLAHIRRSTPTLILEALASLREIMAGAER